MGGSATRYAQFDLCWPLLLHLEPVLKAYPWLEKLSVTVLDEGGMRDYADVGAAWGNHEGRRPRRVEVYAHGPGFKVGVTAVALGDDRFAITPSGDLGMERYLKGLGRAVGGFLDGGKPPKEGSEKDEPASVDDEKPASGWRWFARQPLAIQIIARVIAALIAAGTVAIISVLFR